MVTVNETFESTFRNLDPENWNSVGQAFEKVIARKINQTSDLEKMIHDWYSLCDFLRDTETTIEVAAARNSKDKAAEERKDLYIENISPNFETVENAFKEKVLEKSKVFGLPDKYNLMLKTLSSDKEIFHPENPGLDKEVSLLTSKYDNWMGSLVTVVDGKKYTSVEAHAAFADAPREKREELWRGIWGERLNKAQEIDDLYTKQVTFRTQIAKNVGRESFVPYTYQKLRRFFYGPTEAKQFHRSIAEFLVPIANQIYETHAKDLEVKTLRPWDLSCRRFFEVIVKPYLGNKMPSMKSSEIVPHTKTILAKADPEMLNLFNEMIERGETDLDAREGKRPGAFQTDFPYKKRPFILCNNTGVIDDLYTTLHEFGHAFHSIRMCSEPLSIYRDVPIEAAELASMSTELIAHNFLDLCFSPEQVKTIQNDYYSGKILSMCYIAQVDAFQHWVYENPNHSPEERFAQWSELTDKFGPPIDWSGIEEYKGIYWQQQGHIVGMPFYYIEYAIAQLGALQVETNFKIDRKLALSQFKEALSGGAKKPLPQIYETAGIKLDFSPETVRPVAQRLAVLAGLVN